MSVKEFLKPFSMFLFAMMVLLAVLIKMEPSNPHHLSRQEIARVNQQIIETKMKVAGYEAALAIERNFRRADGSYPTYISFDQLQPKLQGRWPQGVEYINNTTGMSQHVGIPAVVYSGDTQWTITPEVAVYNGDCQLVARIPLSEKKK